MNKIRKWIVRGAAALGFAAASSGAFAQIPVTDLASLTQQIQQVAAWAQQYEQMVQSIKNQQQQLSAMTGARGMGSLLNNETQQALPTDFVSMADKLRSQGAGGASAAATAIYNSIKTYDCGQRFPKDVTSQQSCEAAALATPQNISLLNDSVAAAQQRQSQLKSYAASIDAATDAKAAADLSNRLSLEVAYLQNEKIMMDIAAKQLEQQRELTAQQQTDEGVKRMTTSSGGGSNPFAGGM